MTRGRKNQEYQIDKAENPRNWLHPADTVSVNNTKDDGEDQGGISSQMAARANNEWDVGLLYLRGRSSWNNSNSS